MSDVTCQPGPDRRNGPLFLTASDAHFHAYLDRCIEKYDLLQAVRAVTLSLCGGTGDAPSTSLAIEMAHVYALAGRSRDMSALLIPALLECRDLDDADALLRGTVREQLPEIAHLLAAIFARRGDRDAYHMYERAIKYARDAERMHLVVLFYEEFARTMVLFGDIDTASDRLDEACAIAKTESLTRCWIPCAMSSATVAYGTENVEKAEKLLAEIFSHRDHADLWIFAAPLAVSVALERRDTAAIERWTNRESVEVALRATDPTICLAAATALVIAATEQDYRVRELDVVVERALTLVEDADDWLHLLVRIAADSPPHLGRIALTLLNSAARQRERRVVVAAAQLARAHMAFRANNRERVARNATDAARAFAEMGLTRYARAALDVMVRTPAATTADAIQKAPRLTKREEEVAVLLRCGASNREIADALGISLHTVERHVSSILSQLGLRSRWQMTEQKD